MKYTPLFSFLLLLWASHSFAQSNLQQPTSINNDGTDAHPSAMLDVKATDKGMLVPRMTSPQRLGIASPATGLLVFDTTTGSFWYFNGSAWTSLSGGGGGADNLGNHVANQNLDMNTFKITNLAAPIVPQDAANKAYVDANDDVDDADADPLNEIQSISKSGNTVSLSSGGGSFVDAVNDADADPFNEIQTIAKSGNTVTLSNGGGSFTVDDADASPTNEIQTISKSGNTISLSNGGGSVTDAVDDADANPNNELQTISKSGNTVTLSNGGGSVTVDDADASPTNEIQTISKSGNTISLSNGGGSVTDEVNDADASPTNETITAAVLAGSVLQITEAGNMTNVDLTSLANDADADPNNEIQTISKSGNTISLSNGGGSVTDAVDDADANPNNELQTVSKSGNTVTLSNGGGSFTVDDADASPTNEIQTISKSGNTISLSNGGGSVTDAVDDADANPNNELQTISKSGNTVTLSNGGGSFTDAVDDADASPTNELITGTALSGTTLQITDAGGTTSVDLSSLIPAEMDPQVGANTTNYLPKWNGSALVQSTSVFEDGSGNVGIGTILPHASALMEMSSTTKGVLVPRMTMAQRTAIASPATGLLVFDTTTGGFWFYNGTAWVDLASPKVLADAYGDTKIQVEESPNEGIIRFDLGGTENMVLQKNTGGVPRLELHHTNNNTLLGKSAGETMGSGASNTATGVEALRYNTTGSWNTASGHFSMLNNTTGSENAAYGYASLYSNSGGSFNAAFGNNALYANTGSFNTALGAYSLLANTSGTGNVAGGHRALYSNTTGFSNVAIGKDALNKNTMKSNLVAVGDSALYNNGMNMTLPEQAEANTAVGSKALFSNTIGYNNTAIGYNALNINTSGIGNTAIGKDAIGGSGSGNYNIGIGIGSLFYCYGENNIGIGTATVGYTFGSNNIGIGKYVLWQNFSGSENTIVGSEAGYSNYGSGNVFLGRKAGYNETGSNKLYIDNSDTNTPLIWGDFDSNYLNINGSLGVGINAPTHKLTVVSTDDNTVRLIGPLGGGLGYGARFNFGDGDRVYIDEPTDDDMRIYAASILELSAFKVGIGTATPNSKLSISPSTTEAKITLWDGGSTTNHYGFGVTSGQLNYHTDVTASSHVFYAGGKNAGGTELARITGAGNVQSSNDFYTGDFEGVINAGGGILSGTINMISDAVVSPSNVDGDEDLYIQDDLQLGSQGYKPGGGDWATASDARLKKDITPYQDGLAKVLQINPVRYRYNNEVYPITSDEGKEYIGVLAQEIEPIAPYMVELQPFGQEVREDETGQETVTKPGEMYYTYDGTALTYMLVNAVKEQQVIIEQQLQEIDRLKKLETQLEKITDALAGAGIAVEK